MKDTTKKKIYICYKKWTCSKCVTIASIICLCLAVLITCLLASNPYPAHASCAITWKFSNSCQNVAERIAEQIHNWTGPDNCKNGGEKCLYQLISRSSTKLQANHSTPVKHYVDLLTFDFLGPEGGAECVVEGFSSSKLWYAILDYGTNYCNLHNLIIGSGLDEDPGYSESTKNSQCTQYTSANCAIY